MHPIIRFEHNLTTKYVNWSRTCFTTHWEAQRSQESHQNFTNWWGCFDGIDIRDGWSKWAGAYKKEKWKELHKERQSWVNRKEDELAMFLLSVLCLICYVWSIDPLCSWENWVELVSVCAMLYEGSLSLSLSLWHWVYTLSFFPTSHTDLEDSTIYGLMRHVQQELIELRK